MEEKLLSKKFDQSGLLARAGQGQLASWSKRGGTRRSVSAHNRARVDSRFVIYKSTSGMRIVSQLNPSPYRMVLRACQS